MFIDFDCPVRSAILVYLLAIAFFLVSKPEYLKRENNIFLGPSAIFLAVVVYFAMVVLSVCV